MCLTIQGLTWRSPDLYRPSVTRPKLSQASQVTALLPGPRLLPITPHGNRRNRSPKNRKPSRAKPRGQFGLDPTRELPRSGAKRGHHEPLVQPEKPQRGPMGQAAQQQDPLSGRPLPLITTTVIKPSSNDSAMEKLTTGQGLVPTVKRTTRIHI